MGLTPVTEGKIYFCGEDRSVKRRWSPEQRRQIQMVFQDPFGSLNPLMTIGGILAEPLRIHRLCKGRRELHQRVGELMDAVGLNPDWVKRYPHEFSGGQRQRIGIARALSLSPRLIVCDEPVSALDVSIQAQVLNLLMDIQERTKIAYLFISHDLAVVEHISHRIAVMYLGQIVEIGSREAIFRNPLHPYTRALLDAAPSLEKARSEKKLFLSGEIPSPIHPPSGCRFHPRCPFAKDCCRLEAPKMKFADGDHVVCCHCAI